MRGGGAAARQEQRGPKSHPGWRPRETRGAGARGPTFQAADPPEARVREAAGVLLLRGAAAPSALGGPVVAAGARREVGGVADEGARVEPVVGANGDGHEAEGREGAHRRQQHLHPLLAPEAPLLVPALQRLQLDHGQPGGRGPPPGQRGRGRAGGWWGAQRRQKWGAPPRRRAGERGWWLGRGPARRRLQAGDGVRGPPWSPASGGQG